MRKNTLINYNGAHYAHMRGHWPMESVNKLAARYGWVIEYVAHISRRGDDLREPTSHIGIYRRQYSTDPNREKRYIDPDRRKSHV